MTPRCVTTSRSPRRRCSTSTRGKRAIAESRGLRAFDNLKDFLDSKLFDLVVVATSNQFHCPYTCAALDAGYNVLCEKPAGLSSGEIEKMIDTAKKSGKLLTFHQNRRVDRDLLIVKEALEKFDIGRIFTVENRVGGGRGLHRADVRMEEI